MSQEIKDSVLSIVSNITGVSIHTMLTDQKDGIKARNLAMYILVRVLDIGPSEVGRLFNKNHGIIITARKRIEASMASDDQLLSDFEKAKTTIISKYGTGVLTKDVDAELFHEYARVKRRTRQLEQELLEAKQQLAQYKAAYG